MNLRNETEAVVGKQPVQFKQRVARHEVSDAILFFNWFLVRNKHPSNTSFADRNLTQPKHQSFTAVFAELAQDVERHIDHVSIYRKAFDITQAGSHPKSLSR